MGNFRILPGFIFQIINENIVELKVEVPSTEDHHLRLMGHYCGNMTSSWFWWVSFWFWFSPFKSVEVQLINVIEGSSLIVNTTMSSENNQFIFVVDHGVICSWLWSTDLGHSILWWSNRFLIGWLIPLEEG